MAGKMVAICIRAALNMHPDKSDSLLIIMFSMITQPQYIKNSVSFVFPTTTQYCIGYISLHPCLIPGSPILPDDKGLCKHCQAAKNISMYSERLVPGINQIIN